MQKVSLSVVSFLMFQSVVLAQSPVLPTLPQYDMTPANGFVTQLLNWSPIVWFLPTMLAIVVFGAIFSRLR